MIKDLKSNFSRFEIFFLILIFVNIWPIWINSNFPTLDGPSHLYNAQLLHQIWDGNEGLTSYFAVNNEWIPNWSGHFFLTLLIHLGVPVLLANKLLLMIIGLGLPLSLWRIVRLQQKQVFNVILFFSLIGVYTFLFGMGFYNFGLGILFALLSIGTHIKILVKSGIAKYIGFFFLLSLTFFSHLIAFGMLSFYLLFAHLNTIGKEPLKRVASKALFVLLLCLPFLILTISFVIGREAPSTEAHFGALTLWRLFSGLKIFVLYFGPHEIWLAQALFYLLSVLIVLAFVFNKPSKKNRLWFGLLSFLIVLFFIMPDASSNGSYISRRILIFIFWFLLIALSCFKWPKFIQVLVVCLVLSIQGIRTYAYHQEIFKQSETADLFLEASSYLKDNAVVLDFWQGKGYKERHFASYLGINRPLVLLDNYEANYGYFPIVWQENLPDLKLVNAEYSQDCKSWPSNKAGTEKDFIDNVLIYGNKPFSDCELDLWKNIEKNYRLIYHSNDSILKLYGQK